MSEIILGWKGEDEENERNLKYERWKDEGWRIGEMREMEDGEGMEGGGEGGEGRGVWEMGGMGGENGKIVQERISEIVLIFFFHILNQSQPFDMIDHWMKK